MCISGLKNRFLPENVLSDFWGYKSPNRTLFSFLKVPGCLFCCPKISAHKSLWFGIYRSWSAICSRRSKSRATKFVNFVWGLPDDFGGDPFSEISRRYWSLLIYFWLDFRVIYFRVLNPKTISVEICLRKQGTLFCSSVLIRFKQF